MQDHNDGFVTGDEPQATQEPRRERTTNATREREPVQKNQDYDPVDSFFGGSGRAQFGGISNKLLSTLIEVFNSTSDEYDNPSVDPALVRKNFKIYPLDTGGNSVLPTLVLGLPTVVDSKPYVVYFTFILEVAGPQQIREIRTTSNRDEVLGLPVFSEDRMDRKWREMVKATVSKIGTGAHIKAGQQLIPSDLLDETTETVAREDIARVYANGIDAICGYRESMLQDAGASVQMARITPAFVGGNRRFEATTDFSRVPKHDTSKQPIRSDIAITLYHAEQPNSRDRGRQYDDEDFIPTRRAIGTISVAIDLHVSAEDQSGWGRSARVEEETGFWQPVLNITDMTGEPNVPWSLESSLLLIGSTSILTENFRWVEGLRARTGSRFKSLESLDTLALANPVAEKRAVVDDIGPNTSDADLSDYLNFTVKPDLYYGMVLSPASEKSWCNQIFEQIAMAPDRDTRLDYIDILYDAADNLTGGTFTKLLAEAKLETEAPVVSVDSRLFTGWFIDANGNKRDIREWNVPAILAMHKNNPEEALDIALDFQDTIMPHVQSELNYDLAVRYRILESALGSTSFHLTGTTEMIQVQAWFIEILVEAMVKSGVMPYNNDHNGLRTRTRRPSAYSGDTIREIGRGRRDRIDDRFDRRRGVLRNRD